MEHGSELSDDFSSRSRRSGHSEDSPEKGNLEGERVKLADPKVKKNALEELAQKQLKFQLGKNMRELLQDPKATQ